MYSNRLCLDVLLTHSAYNQKLFPFKLVSLLLLLRFLHSIFYFSLCPFSEAYTIDVEHFNLFNILRIQLYKKLFGKRKNMNSLFCSSIGFVSGRWMIRASVCTLSRCVYVSLLILLHRPSHMHLRSKLLVL